jgi:hypothetical protein
MLHGETDCGIGNVIGSGHLNIVHCSLSGQFYGHSLSKVNRNLPSVFARMIPSLLCSLDKPLGIDVAAKEMTNVPQVSANISKPFDVIL